MIKPVQFKNWKCHVRKGFYGNGRLALSLTDASTGEPIAIATVNIPDAELAANEVFIKDYAGNASILAEMVSAGWLRDTGKRIQLSPWAEAAVCEFTDQQHTMLLGAEEVAERRDCDWLREATGEEAAEFKRQQSNADSLAIDHNGRPYFLMTVLSHAPGHILNQVSSFARMVRFR
jgi:hypothetical protein